jgi:cytochrome c2
MDMSRLGSSAFWFLWHSLAAIVLVLIPVALMTLHKGVLVFDPSSIGMAAAYCVSVVVLTVYTGVKPRVDFLEVTLLFLSIFGCFFLFLLMAHFSYSRLFLVIALALSSAFILLPLILKSSLQKPALVLLMLVLVLSLISIWVNRVRPSDLLVQTKVIRTSLYNLVATYHENFAVQNVTGGAISLFADGYLLALGDGQVYLLSWDPEKKKLESSKLTLSIPLNRNEFVRDAKENQQVLTSVFRTADILVQDFGEKFRLFASHHYWNTEKKCFTVRVSAIRGSYSNILTKDEELQTWETVYESSPCLKFKSRLDPFAGYQIGGQLALLDSQNLLLTMGDHKLDGVDSDEMISQDLTADYGKTILIDLNTNATSIYSIGHRNAQGLYVDRNGIIWSTEHGPNGGDELNTISKGKNYGWPLVTYGTDHTRAGWPFNPQQGRHDGFELPVYAWIPSIGVSSLIGMRGELFKKWESDLLVSSLTNRTIYRVRVEQERVTFTERIEIGWRIRDLIEDKNGRLILWTEQSNFGPTPSAIIIIEPVANGSEPADEALNSAQRGKLLFAQCSGCHSVEGGNRHGIGPDLKGILDRRVASADGYGYSEALKRFSEHWTEERLDAFLENPQKFVPGTSMQSQGIPDPAIRASLIEYLKSQT